MNTVTANGLTANTVTANSMTPDEWHVSGLSVGEVADRMGIPASAVRWYDDHGLLPSERTAGNQRRFFGDVLCRIAMIKASQRVGLSIAEIREALEALPPGQVPTPADWDRLSTRLREVVTARIDELFRLLHDLSPEGPPGRSARSRPTSGGRASRRSAPDATG